MEAGNKLIKDGWFWFSLLSAGLILSVGLWFDFGPDQAIFAYIAWVWKEHHLLPYLGAFAADFPGIFIIHRLALELFGNSVFGFRFFDFLGQLFCVIIIYDLARKFFGFRASGFLAAIFYSTYYFSLGPTHSGQRDDFILWILLGIAAIILYGKNWNWARTLSTGLLAGFAFLVKPTFGLLWPLLGAWFLLEGLRQKRKSIWMELLVYASACLLPSLIIIGIYWKAGALAELYWDTLWYDLEIYAQLTPVSLLGRVKAAVFIPYTFLNQSPLLLAGALVAVLIAVLQWKELKEKELFALVILLTTAGFLSWWLQGKNIPYHRTPVVGLIAILAGSGWAWIAQKLESPGRRWPGKLSQGILYLFLVLLMLSSLYYKQLKFAFLYPYRGLNRAYIGQEENICLTDQRLAAQYLKPLIKPEDQIEFFGWQPFLPYLLEKKLPTRFCVVYHLLLTHWDKQLRPRQRQWREEFSSDLISARPKYFAVSTHVLGAEALQTMIISEPDLTKNLEQEFPELNSFFRRNYKLLKTIGTVEIYELTPAGELK